MNDTMRVIGVMSGTSVDGIDVAVCDFAPDRLGPAQALTLRLVAYRERPYPEDLRRQVMEMCAGGVARLDDLTELNFTLGAAYATAIADTLEDTGLSQDDIDLVACHGQTIYHLTQAGRARATMQIGEAAVIARRLGVTLVSDFRVADMAAGGQGAPLAPLLDALLLSSAERTRALQNIGGIGNVTFLPAGGELDDAYAFDTGPGNSLIDYGARYFSGGAQRYDRDGQLARGGQVDERLAAEALAHPYFTLPPPKSTGRELFGDAFAAELIARGEARGLAPAQIMATLTALTARSIADAYQRFGPRRIDEVIVSGGGAHNATLMEMLSAAAPASRVALYDDFGLPADAKEAVLIALLGYEAIHGRTANLPRCTGALGPTTLGVITPGENYQDIIGRALAVTPSRQTAIRPTKRGEHPTCQPTRSVRLIR